MLNFYRKSLEKDVEKFVEKIKKDSKKLDKESQKFIENIFLEEKDELHYSYGVLFKKCFKTRIIFKERC